MSKFGKFRIFNWRGDVRPRNTLQRCGTQRSIDALTQISIPSTTGIISRVYHAMKSAHLSSPEQSMPVVGERPQIEPPHRGAVPCYSPVAKRDMMTMIATCMTP